MANSSRTVRMLRRELQLFNIHAVVIRSGGGVEVEVEVEVREFGRGCGLSETKEKFAHNVGAGLGEAYPDIHPTIKTIISNHFRDVNHLQEGGITVILFPLRMYI